MKRNKKRNQKPLKLKRNINDENKENEKGQDGCKI